MSVQQHGSAFLAPEGPTQILRPSHQTAASQLPAPHTKPAKQHLQYDAVTAASPLPLPRTQVLGQLHANEATVVGPLEHAPGASVIDGGAGQWVGRREVGGRGAACLAQQQAGSAMCSRHQPPRSSRSACNPLLACKHQPAQPNPVSLVSGVVCAQVHAHQVLQLVLGPPSLAPLVGQQDGGCGAGSEVEMRLSRINQGRLEYR